MGSLQLLISVYLCVSIQKQGYQIAVAMNGIAGTVAALQTFFSADVSALSGIAFPLCTIITLTVMKVFMDRLAKETTESKAQRAELTACEEKIFLQNKLLQEYNRMVKDNERQFNYLSNTDLMTGLPNRQAIRKRLELFIQEAEQHSSHFALVIINVDNFRKFNDSLGHSMGDFLLYIIMLRLQDQLDPADFFGRIDGDEFALIVQNRSNPGDILPYVEKLRNLFDSAFVIEDTEYYVSASFGVSVFPQDGATKEELLQSADTAVNKAKERGKNVVQIFDQQMKAEVIRKFQLEKNLLTSIEKQELYLVFQPQFDVSGHFLRGFEALVRWQSSQLGPVSPSQLIPVAEDLGFIVPMGEWILRQACGQLKSWQEKFHAEIVLSVNVSTVQLIHPDFATKIKDILERTGIHGSTLEFEITESVVLHSIQSAVAVLQELKDLGIKIALDDFGTGYSSLNYLQALPIDTLKIDKSFVDRINDSNDRDQIIGSIIDLVHRLNMEVVAEGVENSLQLTYLKENACDYIQGYIFGKPLDSVAATSLMERMQAAKG